MCGPAAPIMALAATAVTMMGQGMQAMQQSSHAKYQAKIAERNASIENEAAARAMESSRTLALAHYRQVAALKGRQRATAAGNGVGVNFGSAADVVDDTEMLAREDANRIYEDGFQKSRGFEIDASNYKASARSSRQAANNAIVNGVFNMAGTALGGAQQYSKMRAVSAGV